MKTHINQLYTQKNNTNYVIFCQVFDKLVKVSVKACCLLRLRVFCREGVLSRDVF